jgi:hypothetical protein
MTTATKDAGKQVLEEIIAGSAKPYEVISCKIVGNLSQYLDMYYADSFAEFAKTRNGRFVGEFSKFHNCAVTYGYRGYSARKNNGVVDIKQTDTQLLKDYALLLTKEVIQKYNLSNNLKPVKVVAHVPNGNRLIGVLDRNPRDGRHIFVILGLSNYNGKSR